MVFSGDVRLAGVIRAAFEYGASSGTVSSQFFHALFGLNDAFDYDYLSIIFWLALQEPKDIE